MWWWTLASFRHMAPSWVGKQAGDFDLRVRRPAGLLNQIMTSVGFGARIVIGGFCLEPEQLYVPSGQMRRLKSTLPRARSSRISTWRCDQLPTAGWTSGPGLERVLA